MARLALADVAAANRAAGKLVLPSQLNNFMKRDLAAMEKSINPGYAAQSGAGTLLTLYWRFPAAWGAALDTGLISGLTLKLDFNVEAQRTAGAGASPTVNIDVGGDDQDSKTVSVTSWTWTTWTYTWSTLPTGLTTIILEGVVDDERLPQLRRGGTDATPADRASVHLYFDDGT